MLLNALKYIINSINKTRKCTLSKQNLFQLTSEWFMVSVIVNDLLPIPASVSCSSMSHLGVFSYCWWSRKKNIKKLLSEHQKYLFPMSKMFLNPYFLLEKSKKWPENIKFFLSQFGTFKHKYKKKLLKQRLQLQSHTYCTVAISCCAYCPLQSDLCLLSCWADCLVKLDWALSFCCPTPCSAVLPCLSDVTHRHQILCSAYYVT